jgi:hypothetical protein
VQVFGVKFLVLLEGKYLLTGSDLAIRFPWILAQNKVSSLGQNSPIQVGYVPIPPDWTDNDYHLVDHLQYTS